MSSNDTDSTEDRERLRRDLARIKPGDTVRVARSDGVIEGVAKPHGRLHCLSVAGVSLRRLDGEPAHGITAVLEHTPAPPLPATVEDLDALPAWSVATDRDGDAWPKNEDGTWGTVSRVSARRLVERVGPTTIRSIGQSPDDAAARDEAVRWVQALDGERA